MKQWLLAACAASIFAAHSQAAEGCAAAKDLVVSALERVSARPNQNDLEAGLQLLKRAEEMCDENGDAWYYRSLFERQLGNGRKADYALTNARERHSEALSASDDPFRLATPTREVKIPSPPPGACRNESHAAAADDAKPEVEQKWALVIGIASFRDPDLDLKFTVKDASAFADLLRDSRYGRFRADHVKVLEDGQATTQQIKAGLNWLARMACEGDLAVIYIATHGTSREQDVAGANYVVTYDTDASSFDGLYSTAIPMVEISNVVRTRLRARKVAVFLDTCHSGGAITKTITLPASISAQMLDHIREGTGRAILTASQAEEKSHELASYGHGLFTYHLIHALQQQGGRVSIDAVYQYVRDHVDQDASARGLEQHPVFSRSDEQSAVVIGIPPQGANGVPGVLLSPFFFY
ncbi:MAG: caspase family protein [Acidobacteriaceae bacterium]|nr:caspase family protein [Acidobacteriaceae bacterium]MBV9778369.1 caspase family protein [Acidobacteriaceae bacterium]